MLASIRIEEMSPVFTKLHLEGLPFAAVLHRFSDIDRGDPHDHPWPFRSTILSGGYVEQVYHPKAGLVETVERKPGDSFDIGAGHIHRIVDLPAGECWTLIQPLGLKEQEPGFYQFREDGVWQRRWNEPEWSRHGAGSVTQQAQQFQGDHL